MENIEIERVVKIISDINGDRTVPKNVRFKIESTIKLFNEDVAISIQVSKVLSALEEIADDVNLQSYTRTQIWDVISSLEKIK